MFTKNNHSTLVQKKYWITYAVIVMGIILLSVMIYFRFLRSRVPRDIPFNLTEFGFYALIFICFGYIYIIFRLLNPKIPHKVIMKFLAYITLPLAALDKTLKHNTIIRPYYNKLADYVEERISSYGAIETAFLIYLCKLIPSLILLLIFLVDVFLLNKLQIFYCFIFLNIIPLLYSYYKYSLAALKEQYFTFLDERYDSILVIDNNSEFVDIMERNPEAIYHDETVSLREYFNIQLENYDKENSLMDYSGIPFSKEYCYTEYRHSHGKIDVKLTTDDYEILQTYFYELEPKVLNLMKYIDIDKQLKDKYYIKEIKIITYGLYFIAWLYILLKSLTTLKALPLTLKVLTILAEYTDKISFIS